MKNIIAIALSLALSCSAFASDPLSKATHNLGCGQDLIEVNATEVAPGIYIDFTSRKFFGKIEQTILIAEDGKLIGVVFDLGVEMPKYKQSHHIYKYLTKKYGEPINAEYALLWFTNIGLAFGMGAGEEHHISLAIFCN